MILYGEVVVKKLRMFCTSCHICSLQVEASPEKIYRVENETFKFRVEVFVYVIDNLDCVMPNFSYFSDSFDNFIFCN